MGELRTRQTSSPPGSHYTGLLLVIVGIALLVYGIGNTPVSLPAPFSIELPSVNSSAIHAIAAVLGAILIMLGLFALLRVTFDMALLPQLPEARLFRIGAGAMAVTVAVLASAVVIAAHQQPHRESASTGNRSTPSTSAAPSQSTAESGNLLTNPTFAIAHAPSRTELVGVGGGYSAAAGWTVNNSRPGVTMTELVDSTRTPGKKMLKVCTTAYNSGVYQAGIPGAPEKALASVWVYLFSGDVVAMGIGNGGATGVSTPYDTTIAQWVELTVSNDGPATEMVVNAYSTQHNPTCFALDSASMTAVA
jgi:hypothetical protein